MVWQHALGLSYGEIAVHSGCTVRTVERQLLRGRGRLQAMDRAATAQ
jgi:DNA-directed RNA polymerase specialized sigma24 family protein